MRVLLAGATGAIGRPLTRELIAAGHEVAALSRSRAGDDLLTGLGAEPVRADVMDRNGLLRAVDGQRADAVIHQATALKNAKATRRTLRNDPTTARCGCPTPRPSGNSAGNPRNRPTATASSRENAW